MRYYFNKQVSGAFAEVIGKVKDALAAEGFVILMEADIQATLKKKLDKDIHPYVILGACNPPFAFQAISAEDKIGTMLPCNVVVQQHNDGSVEVAAIDPVASMMAVDNQQVKEVAEQIRAKLQRVIESL